MLACVFGTNIILRILLHDRTENSGRDIHTLCCKWYGSQHNSAVFRMLAFVHSFYINKKIIVTRGTSKHKCHSYHIEMVRIIVQDLVGDLLRHDHAYL